jgi:hypothetical protein
MKEIVESVPNIIIDKSLNRLNNKVLFPAKLKKANEILSKGGLPKGMNLGDNPVFDIPTEENAHLHEVIHFLKGKKGESLFPRKRDEAIKHVANQKINTILEGQPNIPLKQVMSLVLDTLPNDLSSATLLSLTKLVIDKYEKHGVHSKNIA